MEKTEKTEKMELGEMSNRKQKPMRLSQLSSMSRITEHNLRNWAKSGLLEVFGTTRGGYYVFMPTELLVIRVGLETAKAWACGGVTERRKWFQRLHKAGAFKKLRTAVTTLGIESFKGSCLLLTKKGECLVVSKDLLDAFPPSALFREYVVVDISRIAYETHMELMVSGHM